MKKFTKLAFMAMVSAGLIFSSVAGAEPDKLNQADIRQEIIQQEDAVNDFLKNASQKLNEKLQAAVADGTMDPQDMESIKAAMKKHGAHIFTDAEKLRETLKEPEQRLKLDMELLGLIGQAASVDMAVKIVNRWQGDIREIMIMTSAQRLQMMKEQFSPEFDALLKEAAQSKNAEVAKAAGMMLNEFFRDPVGKAFPDFPAGMKTTDGKDLNLARFKGKILLVDFWATWCPPCRAEVPNLVKVYQKYNPKGFEIVGISFDEKREDFDKYIEENAMPWPQYFDGKGWQNEVGPTYGIQSIPTMYLLDKEGKVVTTDLRGEKLEEELNKLIK